VADGRAPGRCRAGGERLLLDGPARRNRCPCPACGASNRYPARADGAPRHRLFALEYHCPSCRPTHSGRFFKRPDAAVDTVFVCRSTGRVPRAWIVESAGAIARLVRQDLGRLRAGGVKPTPGDVRCILYGHLIRMAVWRLSNEWHSERPIAERLAAVGEAVAALGTVGQIEAMVLSETSPGAQMDLALAEAVGTYRPTDEFVAF